MTAEKTHLNSNHGEPPESWTGIVAVGVVLTGIGVAAIALLLATAPAIELLLTVLRHDICGFNTQRKQVDILLRNS